MKKLTDLVEKLSAEQLCGAADAEIVSVVYDSRKITEGCLFVAIRGANFDGHSAVPQAVEKKAAAVLVEDLEEEMLTACRESGVAVIKVPDTRYALGIVSAAWFDHPAEKLKTIGITGTKGKTTTTYLIKSMLEHAGVKCGLIGTIEVDDGKCRIPAINTTPESYLVQEYFAQMVENGCRAVVMEVSSQALMMHRVAGIIYDIAVFTNLSPDHIGPNEHKDFEEYLHCKSLLFRQCRVGLVNGDDAYAEQILKDNTCETVERYGFAEGNDYRASGETLVRSAGSLGVHFHLDGWKGADGSSLSEIEAPFPGRFSVYNVLSALAVCRHLEVSAEDVRAGLGRAHVKGRIEMLPVSDEYTLMIDYAHNAMALESLLTTLREYAPKRIVTLFGCGGNRAKSRRYEMGEVSGRLSDFTIITSDNPRCEEPRDIIADIVTGMKKTDGEYVEIPDRKEAIAYAMHHAKAGDVIVLAGKGHEDYQEINGVKHPMDERRLVWEILKEDGNSEALAAMEAKYPELK
ncbi:MAG: UDP-N-acetylmuramoyl-L-alanyl-D-glutamate--2,6-diaminopimelate ligase [Lachnospiraceae bacterium]|nr:UDP-N-acetylmuramoyl-L-alanyl-D-glutamate--2,6-diaminopimelate ligase [Lachnospiraceae bacterium]